MSTMPQQPNGEVSNRATELRLFSLWVVVGFVLIVMAIVGDYKCPPRPPGYPTFLFVGKEWQYLAYDKWVARFECLAGGALLWSVVGVVGFFRRGCVVWLIAGVVFAVCGWILHTATWVDL
jgi:hypothetical protein